MLGGEENLIAEDGVTIELCAGIIDKTRVRKSFCVPRNYRVIEFYEPKNGHLTEDKSYFFHLLIRPANRWHNMQWRKSKKKLDIKLGCEIVKRKGCPIPIKVWLTSDPKTGLPVPFLYFLVPFPLPDSHPVQSDLGSTRAGQCISWFTGNRWMQTLGLLCRSNQWSGETFYF